MRLLELAQWPACRRIEEIEGKPVIGGLLVQTRDVVSETREQMRVTTTAAPQRGAVGGPAVRLAGLPARALQRDRDRRRRRDDRDRRRSDEPRRLGAHRGREGPARYQPELLPGSVLASDAFFPFADGPQLAIDAGVTAIIQPGGSMRDEDVVAAANAAQVAMVATDRRHFRH